MRYDNQRVEPLRCIVCGELVSDLALEWVRPTEWGPIYGLHTSRDSDRRTCADRLLDDLRLEWQWQLEPMISSRPPQKTKGAQ